MPMHHFKQKLTAREAAKLIYQVSNPNRTQVFRIEQAIRSGALSGTSDHSQPGRLVTTPHAVATYMAHRCVKRRTSEYERGARRKSAQSCKDGINHNGVSIRTVEMNEILETSLKDYILHVLLIRRSKHANKRWRSQIIVGQAMALLLISITFVGAFWTVRQPEPAHEYSLIETWLEQTEDEFRIHRFHPGKSVDANSSVVIKVEYYYRRPPNRGVNTIRYFTICDDEIIRVDSEL